jgi:hypothetical protein
MSNPVRIFRSDEKLVIDLGDARRPQMPPTACRTTKGQWRGSGGAVAAH